MLLVGLQGLCEWKLSNIHPALLIIFKNILRSFKTEIKIFLKEHSASAQKLDVLIKNECTSNGIFITE